MTSQPPQSPNNETLSAPQASENPDAEFLSLAALRGLRSAPSVTRPQRLQLRQELEQAMAPYSWFTLGVMAPNAETALAVLRQMEAALGWPALQPARQDPPLPSTRADQPGGEGEVHSSPEEGQGTDRQRPNASATVGDLAKQDLPNLPPLSVFLKGNQRTGLFQLRAEAGLGVGLLITGQEAAEPMAPETWGPMPLDLFA
ncbi:MAG: DUF1824 family protein [Synechococcaceae cyanobacterium]